MDIITFKTAKCCKHEILVWPGLKEVSGGSLPKLSEVQAADVLSACNFFYTESDMTLPTNGHTYLTQFWIVGCEAMYLPSYNNNISQTRWTVGYTYFGEQCAGYCDDNATLPPSTNQILTRHDPLYCRPLPHGLAARVTKNVVCELPQWYWGDLRQSHTLQMYQRPLHNNAPNHIPHRRPRHSLLQQSVKNAANRAIFASTSCNATALPTSRRRGTRRLEPTPLPIDQSMP